MLDRRITEYRIGGQNIRQKDCRTDSRGFEILQTSIGADNQGPGVN